MTDCIEIAISATFIQIYMQIQKNFNAFSSDLVTIGIVVS